MMATTRTMASRMVVNTDWIERSMNTVVSLATCTVMPSGNSASMRGSSFRRAWASSRGLAVDCLMSPRETAGLPLKRTTVRSDSGPISTRPRSRMRTG